MDLSTEDIERIRASWAHVIPASDVAASLFYGELFRVAPETRPLFRNDLALQGKKLIATLAFVVDHLDDADTWAPAAEALAVRHVGYGATAAHYDAVGQSLLWMLRKMLGAGLDDATQSAWAKAYALIAARMLEAAAEATSA